jgi:hypothetical protein
MHLTRPSTPTLVILAVLLLANLVAFNWTAKYLRHKFNRSSLHYGEAMPNLDGPAYNSGYLTVHKGIPNLILYFSPDTIKGRSLSLLKFCELLRQQGGGTFSTTLITAGILPEARQLIDDGLITYPVISDSDGRLADHLGLDAGESGTFFFDKTGLCKLATKQQAEVDDLWQLLNSEQLNPTGLEKTPQLEKAKALPSWQVVDVRSRQRLSTSSLQLKQDQLWVFFPSDCFSCGAPDSARYLSEFAWWQHSIKDPGPTPILVFDSSFLRNDVVSELEHFKISAPAYISVEELSRLSRFMAARGQPANQPLLVRTDQTNAVSQISLIKNPKVAETATTKGALAHYSTILQSVDLDIYDLDSYGGKYYVSDRSLNSVLVFDDKFEFKTAFGSIGSAPGKLFHPGSITVSPDGIVFVQDGGNMRVESFRTNGTFIGEFQTEAFAGFAAGAGGTVYLGQPEKGALVSVYSSDGKFLRSFGKLKEYSDVYGPSAANLNQQFSKGTNRVRISLKRNGNILVNFMLVPILQEYTPQGELVFESRLVGPEIDELTSTTGHLTMSMDGFAENVIALEPIERANGEVNVVLIDGSIYVADSKGQRLRVLQPRKESAFTPEMTGVTPSGDPVLIGLSPRACYSVVGD